MYLPSFPAVRLVTFIPVRLFLRPDIRGLENIPQTGPFVVVSNHASNLDPYLMGYASVRRAVGFMAKEELFRIPVFGPAIRRWGAFPIKRGRVDEEGIQKFYDFIHSDHPVVIFIEGTRTLDGELQPPKKGVGMLLQKVRVPVIPVYIGGTFQCWPKGKTFPKPGKVKIIYGPPVPLDDLYALPAEKPTYRLIAERLMDRIRGLKESQNPSGTPIP